MRPSASVAFLGLCLGYAMAQVATHKGMPVGDHADMFYAASPEQQAELYLRDDRYRDVPISLSMRDTEDGKLLCREGDMIVGRAEDVLRDNLARLAAAARLVDPENPALQPAMGGGRKELLQAMRRLRLGDDAETQRQIAEARLGPWTNTLVGLVTRMDGKTDLFPAELVAAVRKLRPQAFGVGIIGRQYRWPGGVIPYVVRVQGLPISEAIQDWNTKTDRIRLRPYRRGDQVWLEFVASAGCSSYVGRSVARGAQKIMLASNCGLDQVVHEIGHAVGLFHEQSRFDRDRFLILQPQNMQPGTEAQFAQVRVGQASDLGGFDFTSVMLYGPSAFSATGQPTMLPRDPSRGMNWGINHRQALGLKGLSQGDVAAIAALYPEPATKD